MIKKGGKYVHGNGNNSYRSRCPWSYDGTQKRNGIIRIAAVKK